MGVFFVVGTASFLQHELDSRRRGLVEQNTSYARKVIVTLEQTVDLLTNPFALNRAVPEAGGRPTFDTGAELYDLAEDAPLVTHSFRHRDVNVTPDPVLLTSRAYADIRKRVDSTVLRVMGSDYRVFWFSDSINIGRAAETRGVPLGFASSGEQKVFSFALWLAALADTATPATRLGVYGVVNGLGSLWMVGALDALRDFVVATGASIRLQAPQSDKRSFAERKFQPVANIVNSRARGLTH
jgi:hypothetical protein